MLSPGILLSDSKDDFVDFTIKIVETSLNLMRKKSQELGSSVVIQHVFIFDLEGFSLGVRNIYDTHTFTHTNSTSALSFTGCNQL